jgi:hypothetical protein
LIKSENGNLKFVGINEYQFNFGFEKDNGEILFLYGLDDGGAKLIHKKELKPDCLYSMDLTGDTTTLTIPVIDVQDGGLSSSQSEELIFSNDAEIPSITPFTIHESTSNQTFIGFATYKRIIERVYRTTWDSFVERYNSDNNFGIQAIYKIFIYVDDIKEVETVARIISDAGYSTNYTFKSFDNFADSIRNTINISSILILFVFLIASAFILFSFNSYIKVQQKDMGILKHYGYASSEIRKIYALTINRIFGFMSIFILVFIFAISTIFLLESFIKYIIIISLCIFIPMFIINRAISYFMLRHYSNKSILDLLKSSKEFE